MEGRVRSSSIATTIHPVSDVIHAPPRWWQGRHFRNILLLSFGFMFIATAYGTTAAISNNVIHDMIKHGFYEGDGYVSLAIVYLVQLLATPSAPSIIRAVTGKWAVFAGGVGQLIYCTAFMFNSRLLLFIASGVFGLGLCCFWSGHGVVFTANSGATTASTYAAVYAIIFTFSQIWGNLVVVWKFSSLGVIDDTTRRITFGALIGVVAAGLIVLLFIRQSASDKSGGEIVSNSTETVPTGTSNTASSPSKPDLLQQAKKTNGLSVQQAMPKIHLRQRLWMQTRTTFRIVTSLPMVLGLGFFLYNGYKLTLVGSPLPTAIGFNKHFGDARKQLIGISGLVYGGGGILAAILLTAAFNYIGRTIIFVVGALLCVAGLGLHTLNMPLNSTIEDSGWSSILFGNGESSVTICIVASICLGIGDTTTTAAILSIISDVFGHEHDIMESEAADNKAFETEMMSSNSTRQTNSVPEIPDVDPISQTPPSSQNTEHESTATAFAVLNGCQALVSVIVFFLSSYIRLDWYVYTFVPVCIWACVTFYIVERNFRSGRYKNYFRDM